MKFDALKVARESFGAPVGVFDALNTAGMDFRVVVDVETARGMFGAPEDQSREFAPGCIYWRPGRWNAERPHITVWPNGRVAVCQGGDSQWGKWRDGMQPEILLEDGTLVDIMGYETEGE